MGNDGNTDRSKAGLDERCERDAATCSFLLGGLVIASIQRHAATGLFLRHDPSLRQGYDTTSPPTKRESHLGARIRMRAVLGNRQGSLVESAGAMIVVPCGHGSSKIRGRLSGNVQLPQLAEHVVECLDRTVIALSLVPDIRAVSRLDQDVRCTFVATVEVKQRPVKCYLRVVLGMHGIGDVDLDCAALSWRELDREHVRAQTREGVVRSRS